MKKKEKKEKKSEIENEEGKFFGECLVGRDREKNDGENQVFSPRPTKKFSL